MHGLLVDELQERLRVRENFDGDWSALGEQSISVDTFGVRSDALAHYGDPDLSQGKLDGLRDSQTLAEVVVDGWEDMPSPLNYAAVLVGTGCHSIEYNGIAPADVGAEMIREVGSRVALCGTVGKHVDLDVTIR